MGTDDYLYDDPVDEAEDGAYDVYEEVARRAQQHAEDALADVEDSADDKSGWRQMARARLMRAIRIVAAIAALAAGTMAILIMHGAFSGNDELTGSPSSDTPPAPMIGAPPVAWPDQVQAQPHTVPAMIKNTLSTVGEAHGYQFNGSAGTIWRITVEPRAESTLDPLITLYGPSGVEIARADDRSAGDLTAELVVSLPEDGTYRLLVQSSQGGITTGDYLLSLWPE